MRAWTGCSPTTCASSRRRFPAGSRAIAPGMIRFGLSFAVIVLWLSAAELTPVGQAWVVLPWTSALAKAATTLIAAFDPAVSATGATIYSHATGFAVTILPGCNGLEATIVLVAAILAYPAPWKHRLA